MTWRKGRAIDIGEQLIQKKFKWFNIKIKLAKYRKYMEEKRHFCREYTRQWNKLTNDSDTEDQILLESVYGYMLAITCDIHSILCFMMEKITRILEPSWTQQTVKWVCGSVCGMPNSRLCGRSRPWRSWPSWLGQSRRGAHRGQPYLLLWRWGRRVRRWATSFGASGMSASVSISTTGSVTGGGGKVSIGGG